MYVIGGQLIAFFLELSGAEQVDLVIYGMSCEIESPEPPPMRETAALQMLSAQYEETTETPHWWFIHLWSSNIKRFSYDYRFDQHAHPTKNSLFNS